MIKAGSFVRTMQVEKDDVTLDGQIAVQVHRCAMKIGRLYTRAFAAHDLTFSQYHVLAMLWEHGPSTVGAIGDALLLDSNTLTPVLKKLQAHGYVDRARDRSDERRVNVSLTGKGLAFEADAKELQARLIDICGVTAAEIAELRQSVRSLVGFVDKAAERFDADAERSPDALARCA